MLTGLPITPSACTGVSVSQRLPDIDICRIPHIYIPAVVTGSATRTGENAERATYRSRTGGPMSQWLPSIIYLCVHKYEYIYTCCRDRSCYMKWWKYWQGGLTRHQLVQESLWHAAGTRRPLPWWCTGGSVYPNMHVYMYLYHIHMYMYIYICIYKCICIHTGVTVTQSCYPTSSSVTVYWQVCGCTYTCIHGYMYIYTYTYKCKYIHTGVTVTHSWYPTSSTATVCWLVYIHIYICICIYTCIHVYIHVYINVCIYAYVNEKFQFSTRCTKILMRFAISTILFDSTNRASHGQISGNLTKF